MAMALSCPKSSSSTAMRDARGTGREQLAQPVGRRQYALRVA